MNIAKINIRNMMIIFILYWMIISINVIIANMLQMTPITEWWLHTIIFLLFVTLFILTFRNKVKIIYRLLIIPASWIVHVIMTIPAAFSLGILMYSPDHIRTNGEHRAVFILASLPILVYLLTKSKLFVKNN